MVNAPKSAAPQPEIVDGVLPEQFPDTYVYTLASTCYTTVVAEGDIWVTHNGDLLCHGCALARGADEDQDWARVTRWHTLTLLMRSRECSSCLCLLLGEREASQCLGCIHACLDEECIEGISQGLEMYIRKPPLR